MSPSRRVLITGAGSGIGLAVAQVFQEQGAEVIGWDLAPNPQAGFPITAVDVRDPAALQRAAEGLQRLDVLVTCAGIARRASAIDMRAEDWQAVLQTNLSGAFYSCQAVFPALAASGAGLIVNIASFIAHRSGPGRASYAAAKAGVVAMTEVLALDFAAASVRAISVSPGYTRTHMVASAIEAGRLDEQHLLASIPLGRLAEPREMAQAIVALTGPAFQYANGTDFVIDGGIMAQGVQ
ncbi:KR domain-containing protein [Pseudomonas aylmerensis]|uniref:KR domain-containing protein n=1 Tax=Pseudomonas aylmerensis TaxID=1869229 RepID=A0A2T4G543_9PSED|nr:SDR family oxidoreductase [Pseudomonas aylmerensis]PTC30712.1 KR domain-containing protein [Pseudomonas aylmerensis]